MDDVKITTDIEATDQLGMLVRRIQVESPRKGDLRKQAAAIVEKVTYLGWELKVIEVEACPTPSRSAARNPPKTALSRWFFVTAIICRWSAKARRCTYRKGISTG